MLTSLCSILFLWILHSILVPKVSTRLFLSFSFSLFHLLTKKMPESFDAGPCDCCKGGTGLCLFACCCPCFAFKEAADNMAPANGSSNGWLYCILTYPLGVGICALCFLGEEVAQKRGIDSGGMVCSFCKACCDPCCCYSCTVLHESRLYKAQMAAGGGVPTQAMERK